MRIVLCLAISLIMVSISHAKTLTEFCSEVPEWPRGQLVPDNSVYLDAHVGTPVDVDFMKSKYEKKEWVLIDSRGQKNRSISKIPKTVLMTADYNNPELNEITADKFIEKVSRHLKKYHKVDHSPSLEELRNDYKYIVFCNGRKCHRSSYGACLLRMKIGIPEENLFMMFGGYPEWKAKGYPVR